MPLCLVSVYDKSGVVAFVSRLLPLGFKFVATGGTFEHLRAHLAPTALSSLIPIEDFTNAPRESLKGRVKTLHSSIFAGILATDEVEGEGPRLDMVVVNLYPFSDRISESSSDADAVELIDIGGSALLRAAAKNFRFCTVISSPKQYAIDIEAALTDLATRRRLAAACFRRTCRYDACIAKHFDESLSVQVVQEKLPLKYGCNPHQTATVSSTSSLPFEVLNGDCGYINILDALCGWRLVKELQQTLGVVAAASMKHLAPAGVGIATACDPSLCECFDISKEQMRTPASVAFCKARECDPLASFGDCLALSTTVDVDTAKLIAREVSDAIIAPGFSPEALEILQRKKKGKYLVIKVEEAWDGGAVEQRQFGEVLLRQQSNAFRVSAETVAAFPESVREDAVLATIAAKHCPSNSVVLAKAGQTIGVAAGQQSRVDSVRLSVAKAKLWMRRRSAGLLGLQFRPDCKRQARVNTVVALCRGEPVDGSVLVKGAPPDLLRGGDGALTDVCLASDGFFPFRDSVDISLAAGIRFFVQPGGSVRDAEVQTASEEGGGQMILTGVRLFTH